MAKASLDNEGNLWAYGLTELGPTCSGLVAGWRFENNLEDFSGNGLDLSLESGTTVYTIDCKFGEYAIYSTSDYYKFTVTSTTYSSFSLCGWIKVLIDEDDKQGTFLSLYSGGGGGSYIGLNSSGYAVMEVQDGNSQYAWLADTSSIADSVWHHIVGTLDNGTLAAKLYVDGEEVDSDTATSAVTGATTYGRVGTGCGSALGSFANARFDDVRFYDTPLSAAEVKNLYKLGQSFHISESGVILTRNMNEIGPTEGLICYLKFDGDVLDYSGYGNDGSISGDPSYVVGIKGQGLDFDASGDQVDITSCSGLPSDMITVSCWAYVNAMANWNVFVRHDWTGDGSWLLYTTTAAVRFGICNPAGSQHSSIKTQDVSDGWHHLCGTYDGTQTQIYIDGSAGTPSSVTASLDNVGNVTISGDSLAKKMDEIRIYNRCLSQAEITTIYKLGNSDTRMQQQNTGELILKANFKETL